MAADRIHVICAGGAVSGGPELLHQLVHTLRQQGREAYIAYAPFQRRFEVPAAYAHYDCPQRQPSDEAGELIVLPEILTRYSWPFRRARCAIWWLSVDNYFRFPQNHRFLAPWAVAENRWYDGWRRLRLLLRVRPLWTMRGLLHFAQSAYAQDFLARHGIAARRLSDCLGAPHQAPAAHGPRDDVIAYNPLKGWSSTQRVIQALPQYRFEPIANMSAAEVAQCLRRVKIYMDFGHHPGKDRLPREAVRAGCCVLLGRAGAARFKSDYPVADAYLFDAHTPAGLQALDAAIRRMLADHAGALPAFAAWRAAIACEPALFAQQVQACFQDAGRAGGGDPGGPTEAGRGAQP